jgi:CelD/BcsL family acetyltransferase involved in cellulose biosynthesis
LPAGVPTANLRRRIAGNVTLESTGLLPETMSYTALENMTSETAWLKLDLSVAGALDQLGAALDRSALARQATLFHDPRWLAASADQPSRRLVVYAAWDGGELVGLSTFLMHASAVPLALGELTLYAHRVERLNALAAPIVDGRGERAREMVLFAGLLYRLREDLASRQVVFLESVIEGSALFDLLTGTAAPPKMFHAIQNGRLYAHRSAKIQASFDAYLEQLGSRSRADLRANRRRFMVGVGTAHRTRCFRTRGDVAEFVAHASEVSRKTYQYRLLSAGLRDQEALERCYGITAGLGWFRSYVLYVDDKPIAFQVGHIYAGRYYAQEIGYDPVWAPHHVGIFLHTEIIADLAALNGGVTEFDFGNGDNLHKQRLSTDSAREGYFYLIRADFSGSVLAHSMVAVAKVSSALGALLERFGLRKKTRDLLRRLGFSR